MKNTQIFTIHDCLKQRAEMETAARAIRDGKLVVFPTETVYGLGADATNADAAKNIFLAKGRPSDNPLIIHIADPDEAGIYAEVTESYKKLADAFMPGPLTVILKKKDIIPAAVTGGLDTVAVRCPSDPVAHELIRLSKKPIAAPSANLSGKPSPTSPEHVLHDMNGRADVILVSGDCEIGLESTIVLLKGDEAVILRPGAVTYDALCCVLEKVSVSEAVTGQLKEDERPLSPGMKYRHYAPTAPFVLLDGDSQKVLRFCCERAKDKDALFLCFNEETDAIGKDFCLPVGPRDDLRTQARNLFSSLRKADTTDAKIIYGHLPPKTGLGLALYNRMIRAAAHTIQEIK